jgi:hypothetical protein
VWNRIDLSIIDELLEQCGGVTRGLGIQSPDDTVRAADAPGSGRALSTHHEARGANYLNDALV